MAQALRYGVIGTGMMGIEHITLRFFEAATHGAPVAVTAEDCLRAVEIAAAAEQSARERRPIELRGST
jgi:predicted dehydrogenase